MLWSVFPFYCEPIPGYNTPGSNIFTIMVLGNGYLIAGETMQYPQRNMHINSWQRSHWDLLCYIKRIISPRAFMTYMMEQGSRITIHIVKRLKKLISPSNLSFCKNQKNRSLFPILVRKNMLLSPMHLRRKLLPVQYEKEKMVTH